MGIRLKGQIDDNRQRAYGWQDPGEAQGSTPTKQEDTQLIPEMTREPSLRHLTELRRC